MKIEDIGRARWEAAAALRCGRMRGMMRCTAVDPNCVGASYNTPPRVPMLSLINSTVTSACGFPNRKALAMAADGKRGISGQWDGWWHKVVTC